MLVCAYVCASIRACMCVNVRGDTGGREGRRGGLF